MDYFSAYVHLWKEWSKGIFFPVVFKWGGNLQNGVCFWGWNLDLWCFSPWWHWNSWGRMFCKTRMVPECFQVSLTQMSQTSESGWILRFAFHRPCFVPSSLSQVWRWNILHTRTMFKKTPAAPPELERALFYLGISPAFLAKIPWMHLRKPLANRLFCCWMSN